MVENPINVVKDLESARAKIGQAENNISSDPQQARNLMEGAFYNFKQGIKDNTSRVDNFAFNELKSYASYELSQASDTSSFIYNANYMQPIISSLEHSV